MSSGFFVQPTAADVAEPWAAIDATLAQEGEMRTWWTGQPLGLNTFCVARFKDTGKWHVLRFGGWSGHPAVAGPFDTWQQALAAAKVMT